MNTPRTDKEAAEAGSIRGTYVDIDFARKLEAELAEVTKERDRLTDRLDLALDEFKRITALTDNQEILGLCLRGQQDIRQLVPVITQRDLLQRRVDVLPADWLKDSSLETWFPMTAEKLAEVTRQRDSARKSDAKQLSATVKMQLQRDDLLGALKFILKSPLSVDGNTADRRHIEALVARAAKGAE